MFNNICSKILIRTHLENYLDKQQNSKVPAAKKMKKLVRNMKIYTFITIL